MTQTQPLTRPRQRTTIARPLGAALACAVGLAACYLGFVRTADGQALDGEGRPSVPGTAASSPSVLAHRVLDLFGSPLVLGGLLAAVVLTGVLCRRFGAGLLGAAVVGGSVATARVLKLALARPNLGVAESTTHNSFPSGHVAAAAALALAFLFALPPRARWWFALPAAAAVAAVGIATILAGWHRPSDVIGGVLTAATLCALAAALLAGSSEGDSNGRKADLRRCGTQWYVPNPADRG